MARTKYQPFAVTATGVGREDYSANIQKSVEPVVQAWQASYVDYQTVALNVGESAVIETPITSGYMLLLYDYYLSCYPASDINLLVEFFNNVTHVWDTVFTKTANQHIDVRLEKGFPFIGTYRVTALNLGLGAIDVYYSAHGIITLEQQLVTFQHVQASGAWTGVTP